MSTLLDVARLAGVSRSTASRVLSDDPRISEESKARVLAAAETLGYSVNRIASALRGGRSKLIGLVVTNLVNATVRRIIEVVEARAHANGYVVLLGVTEGQPDREATVIDALTERCIDGLIMMQSGKNVTEINRLFESGLAVVDLIRLPAESHPPTVLADNFSGAYQATEHLIELGHSEIAYIGGPLDITSGSERYQGYCKALQDAGLRISEDLVRRGAFLPSFGVEACQDLLQHREAFSALFVANHEALFGVLPVLMQEKIDIPNELSLVGFEDVNWFHHWHPPLTVIDVDPEAMADTTCDLLFRQINVRAPEEIEPVMRKPARLILRESTGKPKAVA